MNLFAFVGLWAEDPLPPGLWQSRDVFTLFGTMFLGFAGLCVTLWGIFARQAARARRERDAAVREKNAEIRAKDAEIARLKKQPPPPAADPAIVVSLQSQLAKAQAAEAAALTKAAHLEATTTQMKAVGSGLIVERNKLRKAVVDLEQEKAKQTADADVERANAAAKQVAAVAALQRRIGVLEGDVAAGQQRIKKAAGKSGFTWAEKVLYNVPEFKPLDPHGRTTPVISMLNLKGGVGKTTATANLGAALARMGRRVLLIDLDLQGSLTDLFLDETRIRNLDYAEKLVGNFLSAAFEGEVVAPGLLGYAVSGMADATCDLVPTTDSLAYAENGLAVRWYLREENRDPRFLLRRELHTVKRVTDAYDVILIDCPPVLNVSCVNALAASDFVIVPVMPSKQTTDRAGVLVNRLKEFQENVNPALKVLGFFANRTRQAELSVDDANRLLSLEKECKDMGVHAPRFNTAIRQSTEVRDSEDDGRPLAIGDDLYAAFAALAAEIIERLPSFCRMATTTQGMAP